MHDFIAYLQTCMLSKFTLKLYALEDNKQDLIIFIFFGFLLEDSTEDRYANKHYANNIIMSIFTCHIAIMIPLHSYLVMPIQQKI